MIGGIKIVLLSHANYKLIFKTKPRIQSLHIYRPERQDHGNYVIKYNVIGNGKLGKKITKISDQ